MRARGDLRRLSKAGSIALAATVLAVGAVEHGCGNAGGRGSGALASASIATPSAPTSPTVATTASSTASTARSVPVRPAPITVPQGTWLKGDFHVHSNYSHDAKTLGDDIATVIRCAERAGLDFTTISDHRTTDCLTDPQFLGARTPLVLIAGEEWGGPGHAGAHGLTRPPIEHTEFTGSGPATCVQHLQKVIDDVHSMGGIFVLNHPVEPDTPWMWDVDRFDGIEAWNQAWAFRSTKDMSQADAQQFMQKFGMTAPGAQQPPKEIWPAIAASGGGNNFQRLAFYEAHLNSGRHIACVGGGDSHYLFLPGTPTTRVFSSARTKDAIMEGVRRSRTQVARSPWAPHLDFTADRDGDGAFESFLGDSIPLGSTVTFKVRVIGAQDGKLDLVKNGKLLNRWMITSQDFTATITDKAASRSWYRVNCYEKLDLSFPNARLFRDLVLGTQSMPWLTSLSSGTLFGGKLASFGQQVQRIVDMGGPAGVWLLIFGPQLGMKISPVNTKYPRVELPDNLHRVINTAVHDRDYCTSVLTSPIWVE